MFSLEFGTYFCCTDKVIESSGTFFTVLAKLKNDVIKREKTWQFFETVSPSSRRCKFISRTGYFLHRKNTISVQFQCDRFGIRFLRKHHVTRISNELGLNLCESLGLISDKVGLAGIANFDALTLNNDRRVNELRIVCAN